MIYKAVKYILVNDSDFATAMGTDDDGDVKIYPIHPRKEVSLPFGTFNITDDQGNATKDNPTISGMDNQRVRIIVYGTNLDTLVDIAEKARIAMDNEKEGGTYNTVVVESIDFERITDDYDQSTGEKGAYVLNLDFEIWSIP